MSTLAPQRRLPDLEPSRPARDPAPSGTVAVRRPDVALLLAHDLKTPLSTISMNLEYVLAELPDLSPEMRSALEDCVAANVRAVRIVSDMAEASRVVRAEKRPEALACDVQTLLAEAVRTLEPQVAARKIHVVRRGAALPTHADAALLGRALERLLEWALRYAAPGGTLEITCADRVAAIRVKTNGPMGSPGGAHASLATHYADAVMRAHGGGVWTEVDDADLLTITVAVPA